MHRVASAAAVALACAGTASAAITSGEAAMLATAARVAQDLRANVPPDYWQRATCVVVVPGAGVPPASGVMSCRARRRLDRAGVPPADVERLHPNRR